MADTPEIPEAEDPFSQRVAITIAVLAVIMSLIGNRGDNAKTESILKTTEAANKWSYFQAKSIKEAAFSVGIDELGLFTGGIDAAKRDALAATYAGKVKTYEAEKAEIKRDAEALDGEANHGMAINDRCDLASLALQIAVILCSVAILVKRHPFWWLGMGVGAVGAAVGATAFLM